MGWSPPPTGCASPCRCRPCTRATAPCISACARKALQFVSDDGSHRMIGKQLNITEARHRLARRIFFGQRGELRRHYREGMEDQLGALGLALNAVVLWNSLCLDRAAKQLAADGFPVTDDLPARLSPLQFDHINFLGRYAFFRLQEVGQRPLREPSAGGADGEP
ncbi:Tn3 family transposase [Streptomyces sp. NPDC006692]|uniref:Tn3 family transposase n=1 Tax=Streptomyces sp. NPDC006692 TaxID=3364758 RepID=UPI003689E480